MKTKRPLVIALAGPISAGKSTTAHFLERQFGFEVLSTRRALSRILLSEGEEVSDANLQQLGARITDVAGPNGLNELILENYGASRNYVVDSLRHLTDDDYFARRFGDTYRLVYITAPESLRRVRFQMRTADGRDSTDDAYLGRATHPVEAEVGALLDRAAASLVNLDFDDLISSVVALVLKWGFGTRLTTLQEMLEAILRFHQKHGFDVNSKSKPVMHYRMGLLLEEMGEINECLSKGRGDIGDEHADLLILLLGNCITMGIDLEAHFWGKYEKIMRRTAKKVGTTVRVSNWRKEAVPPPDRSGYYVLDFKSLMRPASIDSDTLPQQLELFDAQELRLEAPENGATA